MARTCSPNNVSQLPIPGCIVSSVSFCIQDANYACATQQGILTKIRVKRIRVKAKFCEHFQIRRDHSIPLILTQNTMTISQIKNNIEGLSWLDVIITELNAEVIENDKALLGSKGSHIESAHIMRIKSFCRV